MLFPDRTKPIEKQTDEILLRLVLWGEARGERDAFGDLDSEGMLAVAHVVRNRMALKARSLRAIILQPWQFSCFNQHDPNRAKMLGAPMLDKIGWTRADAVADLFEKARTIDPTLGSTHYCTSSLWGRDEKGAWYGKQEIAAGRTKERARISSHVFGVAPW